MSKKIWMICFLFSMVFMADAQNKNVTAVSIAVEKLRLAMIDGNGNELGKIVSEKLSYGHSSGVVDNKKQFIEKLASGKSDFVSIDLTQQTISISKKIAVVRHVLKAKTNDSGKPGEAYLSVLLIWEKQLGNWKLLARQAVKIS